MASPAIRVGITSLAQPPLSMVTQMVYLGRVIGLEGLLLWDHFKGFVPRHAWNEDYSWTARDNPYHYAFYDYRTILGHVASRAGRLRIGVGVTEPIRYHPVSIAQSMLTLSHLTKRPPILGIGAGERVNIEPYGLPFDRLATRVEEALQIIRRCFDSNEPITFHGKVFKLDGAFMDLQPKPGNVPEIWVAAHGPRMLRLTGQYADGWYPSHAVSSEDYASNLRVIQDAAREAGRDPQAITPALNAYVFMAPTDEEARQLLDSAIGRMTALAGPSELWERHGKRHPLGDGFRGFVDLLPETISEQQFADGLAAVTPEILQDAAYAGSPETLARRFREFGEAGLRYLSISPYSAGVSKRNFFYLPRGLWRLRRLLQ